MIYIKSFANYDEFKEVFGFINHGNGVKSRKNKILLAALKDRRFVHHCLCSTEEIQRFLSIRDMASLKAFVQYYMDLYSVGGNEIHFELQSIRYVQSSKYKLDNLNGICEDMSANYIRYVNVERNRVSKMKAGKFITEIIEESPKTAILPEQIKRWVGEEFAREWQAYAASRMPQTENLTLHVGSEQEDFRKIYSTYNCVGNFGSCMAGSGQYYFYDESINASAAYLTNENNDIVARCIIYNEVQDEDTGELLRLAERQYSTGSDNILKQILVNKLIKEGHIDGYKRVGASCHDAMDFVLNNGEPLRHRLSIENNIDYGDTLSYQDTFKYLDMGEHTAYNYDFGDSIDLAITESALESPHDGQTYCEFEDEWYDDEDVEYDYYHDVYIPRRFAIDAIYNGRTITIDENHTDDFSWSERKECYIHKDECKYIKYLDDYVLNDEAAWSRYHGRYLFSDGAYYSEITDDWYETIEDMVDDGGVETLEEEPAAQTVSA